MCVKLLVILLFLLQNAFLNAQVDSSTLKRRDKVLFAAGTSAVYGISVIGMNELWYKNYEHSSFHWINDSREWQQMDKAGHFFSSYAATRFLFRGLNSAGVNKTGALLYASGFAILGISTIEVFDGFSSEWGASASDILANSLGVSLFSLQSHFWNDEKILPKISWHPTTYAAYRPDLLGNTLPERMFKDYNGHTLWLSFNLESITGAGIFPGWLCLSIGYGAEGMISGYDDPLVLPHFNRYRQYYLSLDADLNKIHTSSKFLKNILRSLNLVKIPFPALELNPGGIKLHGLYL